MHDGRVWRNSPLKRKLDEVMENNYNNQDFILRNAHLLGDAAYARTTTMIPLSKTMADFSISIGGLKRGTVGQE